MIVFIAPFPAMMDEKDGFIQRIAWIDSLVADNIRIYLDISFFRFWFARRQYFGKVTVFKLNAFIHFFLILSLINRASVVYVHSIFNSIKVLPAYWYSQIITDLHGVVPEELKFSNKLWRAAVFGLVERIVLRQSRTVVYVTSAMKMHFYRKYRRNSPTDYTIAILPKITDIKSQFDDTLSVMRDPSAVIYAGGLQAWQNVKIMVESAARTPKFKFIFLSGEAPALQQVIEQANVVNFTCLSVDPLKVSDYYVKCTYGFILRDSILLNRVACPTKLVEYLYWGVIPIILTSDIGDFSELGFTFISLGNFIAGNIPDVIELERMREINRKIVDGLFDTCNNELLRLSQELKNN